MRTSAAPKRTSRCRSHDSATPRAMVSIVPPNALGAAAVGELQKHGVDTAGVCAASGPDGPLFLDAGRRHRGPPQCSTTARARRSRSLRPSAIDWPRELAGASWLHLSGIASALGEQRCGGEPARRRSGGLARRRGVVRRQLPRAVVGGERRQRAAASAADACRTPASRSSTIATLRSSSAPSSRKPTQSNAAARPRPRRSRVTAARAHLLDDTNRERCAPSRAGCA